MIPSTGKNLVLSTVSPIGGKTGRQIDFCLLVLSTILNICQLLLLRNLKNVYQVVY